MIELSTEEKILEIILDNGIKIGSMAWGGATEMSDVDYAISRTNFLKIVTLHDEVGPSTTLTLRWVSNYSDNLMFNIENIKLQYNEKIFKRVLNLIVYEDDDLNKINTLNFYMDELRDTKLYNMMENDKMIRINIVESFLNDLFVDKKAKTKAKETDFEFPF